MGTYKKKQILEMLALLERTNELILQEEPKESAEFVDILAQCQDIAIRIGTDLEEREENYTELVEILEDYCENVYQQCNSLENYEHCRKLAKKVRGQLTKLKNKIQYELPADKKEVVFLPYKASMWDSLESVWLAARDDESCEAYVVPIPYFDKNPDGSFGEMHYEGDKFPDYVPITSWEMYDIEARRPEVAYIHNPYDNWNYVTSVHPMFYSSNLKKYVNTLVYIPYYATSGSMSAAQKMCSAYLHVDYIVTQNEKMKDFFDHSLPTEKFLPFGSPKFDRVLRKCKNPPEPPAEWKEQLAGKKVYFYNTSLNGMLGDTAAFLKKMEYVFQCFQGRNDVCLLWRPHPLLESTFDSMRQQYKPIYHALKQWFLQEKIGIYDTTPDITDTIALSDVYLGDAATSVTSLFGVAGKPLFIFNNQIHSEPQEEDWRGEILLNFELMEENQWLVVQGNKLYYSESKNYSYQYFCDCSDYSQSTYYGRVLKIGEQFYVCPRSAQDILVLGENGIEKRIPLEKKTEKAIAFSNVAWKYEQYLLLVPYYYPALVRYNTETGEITYFTEHLNVFLREEKGELRLGGSCVHKGYLFIASPVDDIVYSLEIATGEEKLFSHGGKHHGNAFCLVSHNDNIWFLPFEGRVVTCWNPESRQVREYTEFPEGFVSKHLFHKYNCEERPFMNIAFYKKKVYLAPQWGNMYVQLDIESGKMTEWIPPFKVTNANENYYFTYTRGMFLQKVQEQVYEVFSMIDRKIYRINFEDESCEEVLVSFEIEELKQQESGFGKYSQWLPYACQENAFNSLPDLLNGEITGNQFDKETQLEEFAVITADREGTCGKNVHTFIMKKTNER